MKRLSLPALLVCALALVNCGGTSPGDPKAFLEQTEQRMAELGVEAGRAQWVQSNFITDDTEALAAKASQRWIEYSVQAAKQAAQFDKVPMAPELRRKMDMLKNSLTLAAPADPKESAEATRLAASLEGMYGKGKFCDEKGANCLDIGGVEQILTKSNDPTELLRAWNGWHTISPPMKNDYARLVELANKGAREIGFKDSGEMWRLKYDMPAADFAKEVDRLWEQVKPLYVALHTYIRTRLREKYGPSVVPESGPIPAHLFGNIWAQDWSATYRFAAPAGADPGYDLTQILKARKADARQMVKHGEAFFNSLGFAPLPATFWQRSLFVKPRDREVVCHASAWDVDDLEDLRIKMCIDPDEEDFITIHHELGHNIYQRAYHQQPYLFKGSANDGFHEAIGDTIALSVTPGYLVKIGFLTKAPDASKDIGLLLQRALEKVSFLPFGLLVDQWRWKVFSGEIKPDNYNQAWWDLRAKYQGVAPPSARPANAFDPGAKYHVPGNVPYTRYFLAAILQFQFHRALAETAGCKVGSDMPLHRCSIYGSRVAGGKLNTMLANGLSKPWQDSLAEITGKREMDGTAMREYFAPLEKWLNEQNKGKPSGW